MIEVEIDLRCIEIGLAAWLLIEAPRGARILAFRKR
jgi:hypothetical protein